jgi:4-hydroxybenzoate polyprenyltransferase
MPALLAAWAFGMHLMWQLKRLDINDGDTCFRLFLSNRDAGLIASALLGLSALL